MDDRMISRWFAAATVVMVLIFMGNRAIGAGLAVQPPTEAASEAAEAVISQTETVHSTLPAETEPAWYAVCKKEAAEVEGEHVFAYDPAAETMVFCNTPQEETLFPASITKLFSAYAALRILEPETVVTAGYELGLVQPGSSTAYIALGSELTVEMLVKAMLLPSGNDAAYVLSAAAGRSLAEDPELGYRDAVALFLEELNRLARELGFRNTHFSNPDGYHADDHYSCPADIARMAVLALNTPLIAETVGCAAETVTFVSGETITWRNTNRLVQPDSEYYCAEAEGLKTGYTHQAGYCLLAAFENEQRKLLVGIFGAQDKLSRYSDAAALFAQCQ